MSKLNVKSEIIPSATPATAWRMALLGGLFAGATVIALGFGPAPAQAYDDDVEVVCWDRDSGETECMEVDDLAAECALTDPEYTTDQCGGLLENRRPASGGLTTIDMFDENYDDDKGRGRGDRGNRGGGDNGGGGGSGAGGGRGSPRN